MQGYIATNAQGIMGPAAGPMINILQALNDNEGRIPQLTAATHLDNLAFHLSNVGDEARNPRVFLVEGVQNDVKASMTLEGQTVLDHVIVLAEIPLDDCFRDSDTALNLVSLMQGMDSADAGFMTRITPDLRNIPQAHEKGSHEVQVRNLVRMAEAPSRGLSNITRLFRATQARDSMTAEEEALLNVVLGKVFTRLGQ